MKTKLQSISLFALVSNQRPYTMLKIENGIPKYILDVKTILEGC
jgi:hypothetical protein